MPGAGRLSCQHQPEKSECSHLTQSDRHEHRRCASRLTSGELQVLPGRTQNGVKNHWHATLRKMQRAQVSQQDVHKLTSLQQYLVQIQSQTGASFAVNSRPCSPVLEPAIMLGALFEPAVQAAVNGCWTGQASAGAACAATGLYPAVKNSLHELSHHAGCVALLLCSGCPNQ